MSLDELKRNNLIADYESSYFAGLSRGEVIRKIGLASIIALPMISAIVAAQAASSTCSFPTGCKAPGIIVCPPGCSNKVIIYQNCTTRNGTCGNCLTAGSYACNSNPPYATTFDLVLLSVA